MVVVDHREASVAAQAPVLEIDWRNGHYLLLVRIQRIYLCSSERVNGSVVITILIFCQAYWRLQGEGALLSGLFEVSH
jgi:hypothetical protein